MLCFCCSEHGVALPAKGHVLLETRESGTGEQGQIEQSEVDMEASSSADSGNNHLQPQITHTQVSFNYTYVIINYG